MYEAECPDAIVESNPFFVKDMEEICGDAYKVMMFMRDLVVCCSNPTSRQSIACPTTRAWRS